MEQTKIAVVAGEGTDERGGEETDEEQGFFSSRT